MKAIRPSIMTSLCAGKRCWVGYRAGQQARMWRSEMLAVLLTLHALSYLGLAVFALLGASWMKIFADPSLAREPAADGYTEP